MRDRGEGLPCPFSEDNSGHHRAAPTMLGSPFPPSAPSPLVSSDRAEKRGRVRLDVAGPVGGPIAGTKRSGFRSPSGGSSDRYAPVNRPVHVDGGLRVVRLRTATASIAEGLFSLSALRALTEAVATWRTASTAHAFRVTPRTGPSGLPHDRAPQEHASGSTLPYRSAAHSDMYARGIPLTCRN